MARSSDGVQIAYAAYGVDTAATTPVVVLVHGWSGDRTYWDAQIEFLAERYAVVALDLGGHGESGRRRADWSMESFGEDVVAVVDELGPRKVVLVGHAMGGDVVVHAAVQLGDRVLGIVWVDTYRSLGRNPAPSEEEVEAFLAPFRDDFAGATEQFARGLFPAAADPELVARIAADMVGTSREVALGSLAYAPTREPVILAALARITAPVVAINPDTMPTDAGSLRRHGVEVVILSAVGHFAMLEDPEQFNPVLASAIERGLGG